MEYLEHKLQQYAGEKGLKLDDIDGVLKINKLIYDRYYTYWKSIKIDRQDNGGYGNCLTEDNVAKKILHRKILLLSP